MNKRPKPEMCLCSGVQRFVCTVTLAMVMGEHLRWHGDVDRAAPMRYEMSNTVVNLAKV